ncbi:splicing factor, CC1-like protein [Tilletiaria anomala UBC 951]|uniref:Splicing factor, CC1-like protein n=1 Tax=Tilletiaria anomala (strain ATCC 24038 / CBS 436.72 / UBC 951) TaxID=1037660 RepID=A0A066WGS3_TILAU|nr:splicing factor, CC1-like protein [Tilletiaria anomala UBC 951]KDN53001.1 splicing factor, CC1-like protein [Tilletiaria anomala UBC 951]
MTESPPRSRMRAYSNSSSNPSLSPSRERPDGPASMTPQDRERQLAEELRRRAVASKAHERGRPRDQDDHLPRVSRSRSRSRTRSIDSRRMYSPGSRRSIADGDDDHLRDSERRRRRRQGYEDNYERRRPSSRRDAERHSRSSRDGSPRNSERERYDSRGSRDDRRHYDEKSFYDRDRGRDRHYDRHERGFDRGYDRRPPPRPRSPSPRPEPDHADYEERSVFCSQLAARLTQRDLGEFFEEKLGEGSVVDVRIVMDKVTRRSKGVGYVELADRQLLPRALGLSGENLFGIPILIQLTDAARNRSQNTDMQYRPNLVNAVETAVGAAAGATSYNPLNLSSTARAVNANTAARLYVGSLHFDLTSENVKEVFEPFGEIEYVDLHREPGSGKSKGFCFVQYKEPAAAEQALAHMDGIELYGRAIKVGHVNARGNGARAGTDSGAAASTGANQTALGGPPDGGQQPTALSAFDEGGGGGLNPMTRAALMEKLMRTESAPASRTPPAEQQRPTNIPQATSKTVLLQNMFDPAEEVERDWDTDLANDVKEECEAKYGGVERIHVERESAGDIYVKFVDVSVAAKAIQGLNGRFFGGRSIKAHYIAEAIFNAKLG